MTTRSYLDYNATAPLRPQVREAMVAALTTYQVTPDGSGVGLNLIDVQGRAGRIVMPVDCLRVIGLTIPKMVSDVMSGGRGDPSVRIVHRVNSWFLERAADGTTILFSIETGDGVRISFALSEGDLVEMCDAVSAHEVEAFGEHVRGH